MIVLMKVVILSRRLSMSRSDLTANYNITKPIQKEEEEYLILKRCQDSSKKKKGGFDETVEQTLIQIIIEIMTVIKKLHKLDNKISHWIHSLDHLLPTAVLYPFTAFFHPGLIWVAYLSVYYLSQYNLRFTLLYALGTLICLIITFILKKITKRTRPELNIAVSKPHHFRKKQKNCSMPSGDAFQSAVFTVFLSTLNLNPFLLLAFHLGVCIGRVYYMCHWVADTLVASIIGVVVARLVLSFENEEWFHLITDVVL